MNALPASPRTIRAVMHLLLYVGPVKLGFNDTVVMSFGLHYKGRSAARQLEAAVAEVLNWWASERAAGRAPRLLWRPTSPQHFATETGLFLNFSNITTTTQCRADLTMKDVDGAYPDHNFTARFQEQQAWFNVLPVFAPSLERHDEHPMMQGGSTPLSVTQLGRLFQEANVTDRRRPDCSHFCTPSSTVRLWSQVLLAWLFSFRERSMREDIPREPKSE